MQDKDATLEFRYVSSIFYSIWPQQVFTTYQSFPYTTPGHYSENSYLITLIFWIVPLGLYTENSGTDHFTWTQNPSLEQMTSFSSNRAFGILPQSLCDLSYGTTSMSSIPYSTQFDKDKLPLAALWGPNFSPLDPYCCATVGILNSGPSLFQIYHKSLFNILLHLTKTDCHTFWSFLQVRI